MNNFSKKENLMSIQKGRNIYAVSREYQREIETCLNFVRLFFKRVNPKLSNKEIDSLYD